MDMQLHYKEKHLQERYPCSFCSKSFNRKDYLLFHSDKYHPEKSSKPLPFRCTESACEAAFSVKWHLRQHIIRKHHPELLKPKSKKKEECPICHKHFMNLPSHITGIHETQKRLPCQICFKTFPKKVLLRHHVQYVHSGEKRPTVPCTICGKEFTKSRIKRHVDAIHKGIRHKCPLCEKDYSSESDMNCHIKAVHQGIKMACHFCSMEFQRGSDRNRHERQSHPAEVDKTAERRVIQIT